MMVLYVFTGLHSKCCDIYTHSYNKCSSGHVLHYYLAMWLTTFEPSF